MSGFRPDTHLAIEAAFLLQFGNQGADAYTGLMKAGIAITVAFAVVWVLYVTCLAHMADLGSVTPR